MINLLLGAPGGGKSYEATAFHVLPALEAGRKVITNLPLNIAEIQAIIPDASHLLVVVTESTVKGKLPFSVVDDWKDDWKNEKTGVGALFVVDECHQVLPRSGTEQAIVEFAALHRHTGCDWLLMTQDHGKINKDIKALIQLCYVVRKNVALGNTKSYTRSVYDGVKTSGTSNRVSQQTRDYKPAYFKFYKSHTLSSSAVLEENAKDVTPFYKKFVYGGIAMTLAAPIIGFAIYYASKNKQPSPPSPVSHAYAAPSPHHPTIAPVSGVAPASARMSTAGATPPESQAPLQKFQLRLMGVIQNTQKTVALFSVESNGAPQYQITNQELAKAGYEFHAVADCVVTLKHQSEQYPTYVHCGHTFNARSSLRDSVDAVTPAPKVLQRAEQIAQPMGDLTLPDSGKPNLMKTPPANF